MEQFTKESPGCYHSMIRYLATKEQTEVYKLLRFNTKQELYASTKSKKKPFRLKYRSYDIRVIDGNGDSHQFILGQLRYDHPTRNITLDHFIVKVMKGMSDFTTVVKSAGSYTDSLGGGWTQKVSMYKVDDNYFADMDCACG
jgi:hypothetical protein